MLKLSNLRHITSSNMCVTPFTCCQITQICALRWSHRPKHVALLNTINTANTNYHWAITSLYSITWSVFITKTECLLCGTNWIFKYSVIKVNFCLRTFKKLIYSATCNKLDLCYLGSAVLLFQFGLLSTKCNLLRRAFTKAWDLSCTVADLKKERKLNIPAVEQNEGREKKFHNWISPTHSGNFRFMTWAPNNFNRSYEDAISCPVYPTLCYR